MPSNRYAAHERLVSPARVRPELWRLLLGSFIAVLVFLICNNLLIAILLSVDPFGSGLQGLFQGARPLDMFILLFSFGFMPVGIYAAVRLAHRRNMLDIFGPAGAMLRQFRAVVLGLAAVYFIVIILPPWNMGAPLVPNLSFGTWLSLLPLSVLAVLVQTSAEEIVFRGYLQQQLAARFNSPLVWMVLPSVLFGFAHYMPEGAGDFTWVLVIWSMCFGLLMADLTARSGTLGPAIAVHFVNNLFALLVVSLPDSLSGLSLYLSPFSMMDTEEMRAWLPVDFAMMVIAWLAARLVLRR